LRSLNETEKSVVRWFAQQLDDPQRQSVLSDLDKATAQEIRDEQLTVRFEIEGYKRPAYRVERPFEVDAAVLDADGVTLAVVLSADEADRLFELQVIRFDKGPVLGPDWATLRRVGPDEVIRLNHPPERRTRGSKVNGSSNS
jgi:hypothetical protein